MAFRVLEARRVLSVNATFAAGVLDIAIQNDGGNTDATLMLADGEHFFVDANGDQTYDDGSTGPVELRGLLADLTQVKVGGDAGVGTFFWRDNFSAAVLQASGNAMQISAVDSVDIAADVLVEGDVSIQAEHSIQISGSLDVDGNLLAEANSLGGTIHNSADSSLRVSGNASFQASEVALGVFANDSVVFGSLTFNSTGAVAVEVDSSMSNPGLLLVGDNSANSLLLHGDGTLQIDSSAQISVNHLELHATGVNSSIVVDGGILAQDGEIRLFASDRVEFGSSSYILSQGATDISIQADGAGIFMADGSTITTGMGAIHFSALTGHNASILLGNLSTDSSSATAVQIQTSGSIFDGTADEDPNITAMQGTIRLFSKEGGIGTETHGINIDAQGLVFDAASLTHGFVHISDSAGGVRVIAASQAGAGLNLVANSPLVISANITVGASSTFTAGNSANSGDNITIDNAAIVALNSSLSGTLTFMAGDDIVFNTGQIITTGGGNHTVVLRAALDHANLGAGDGDRGAILQDGSAIIEVVTDNLIVSAAEGINLDTSVQRIDAISTLAGNIVVHETDNILLFSVATANGSIEVIAGGQILSLYVAANGTGSNITMLATGAGGFSVGTLGVVRADNVVFIAGVHGNIVVADVRAIHGSLSVLAISGDIAVGSLSAAADIFLSARLGRIFDVQDDELPDLIAGGSISLDAYAGIGGSGLDNRIELAADSRVTATSTTGDIHLRGLGALTLTEIRTDDGAIDILADGRVRAVMMDSSATDSDANDISIMTTVGDVEIVYVRAGTLLGDVRIHAFGNILDGDTSVDDVDIEANDVTLTAQNGSIGGQFSSIFKGLANTLEVTTHAQAGDAQNQGNLIASAPNGLIALKANVTGSATIDTNSLFWVSDGDLDASTLTFTANNLALIADADANGSGVLRLGPTISVSGDLRLEGADILSASPTLDITADRLRFVSGGSADILAAVNYIDATSRGDLSIFSTRSLLSLVDLNCDNVALETLGSASSIALITSGTVTVSDDVIVGNDGLTSSLGGIHISFAPGAVGSILVHDALLADHGNIVLIAPDAMRIEKPTIADPFDENGDDNLAVISTANGNISIVAGANGNGGELFMADGSRIIAGRSLVADYAPGINGNPSTSAISLGAAAKSAGQAEISLTAFDTITLGSVQSANNTAHAISIESLYGQIVDGGDFDTDLVADNTGARITLKAVAGIGNTNAIETQAYALALANAGPNGQIAVHEVASGGDLIVVQAINAANDGNIVIAVDAGSLTLTGQGATVSSGHITLTARDDLNVQASITANGAGSIYLASGNFVDGNAGSPQVDGINVQAVISSASGDILLVSQQDIYTSGKLSSDRGNVGLISRRDIAQDADIETLGDVLVDAGGNLTMSSTATTRAGNHLLAIADGMIGLGLLVGANVAVRAGQSIVDNNGGGQSNVRSQTLSLIAGNAIGRADASNGTPEINEQAIDTEVADLAAQSSMGIYVQQLASGGDLQVTHTNGGSVVVHADQVLLNGGTSAVTLSQSYTALSDLTSSHGPIKLVVDGGSLTITDGLDAYQTGVVTNNDILLSASSDIITRADVRSSAGHVTLLAGDDIDLKAALSTGDAGSIYLRASNSTVDFTLAAVDGIAIDGAIATDRGSILASSQQDIRVSANVSSSLGSIGLVAGRELQQAAHVMAGGDIMVRAGTNLSMLNGVSAQAGTNLLMQSGDSIQLSLLTALNISLEAGQDILDNNGPNVANLQATNLRIVAGGSIGQADGGNGTPDQNAHSIDMQVGTVAASASSGVYLQQSMSDLTVGHVGEVNVFVDVTRVHFNSTTSSLAESYALGGLDDLTSLNQGPIKVVVLGGQLTITDGLDGNAHGIQSGGDILLWSSADILVQAAVVSDTGNITLQAADDLHVQAAVSTSAAGSIYLVANNASDNDVSSPEVDGINVDGSITTVDGDILLSSAKDIRTTARITSSSGNVGLVSTRDVLQTANVSTGGDVLVTAGRDYTMASGAVTGAGANILVHAGSTIRLGLLTGLHLSLEAAEDIVDNNGGDVANLRATSLRMVAGGIIGGPDALNGSPDVNTNALDLELGILAAQSSRGIYLQELAAGGNLVIGHVDATHITIDVSQVRFNSTTNQVVKSLEMVGLDDLTTSIGGPVKVMVQGGELIVEDGQDADSLGITSAGDILLRASADVVLNAQVASSQGHITIQAGDDVDLNANVTAQTSGSITIVASNQLVGDMKAIGEVDGINVNAVIQSEGNVLLESVKDIHVSDRIQSFGANVGLMASGNVIQESAIVAGTQVGLQTGGDLLMAPNAVISARDVLLQTTGAIELGLISAANTSIEAGGSILNNNGDLTNIHSSTLSMRSQGSIGRSDVANGSPDYNGNALTLVVETLAASSVGGIYVIDATTTGGALVIGHVTALDFAIQTQQARFNSTLSAVNVGLHAAALDDLTSAEGAIKVRAQLRSILVLDGLDGDGVGVSAEGAGDILLSAAENITTQAVVTAHTGNISLRAGNDVQVNASLATHARGSIFIEASNQHAGDATLTQVDGVNVRASVTTVDGSILIRTAQDIQTTAQISANGVAADVGLLATGNIIQGANVSAGRNVLIEAGQNLNMTSGVATSAGSSLLVDAGQELRLGLLTAEHVSLQAGGGITDANADESVNIRASSLSMVAGQGIGVADRLNGNPHANANAIDLHVDVVAASSSTGMYLQQLAAGGDLRVGHVDALTVSVQVDQANFNSTTNVVSQSRFHAQLDDLSTSFLDGAVKVRVQGGGLLIEDGWDLDGRGVSVAVNGDILLAAAGDIVFRADIFTAKGQVSIVAGDDVYQNANIQTGNGVVYVLAQNSVLDGAGRDGVLMSDGTSTRTPGGLIRIESQGDIVLGLLDTSLNGSSAGAVSLIAAQSLLDGDGDLAELNIRAHSLRIQTAGSVGLSDANNGDPNSNLNAIDTQVDVLAIEAGRGIYVRELDGLTVDALEDLVGVVVNFNSTTTTFTDPSIADLSSQTGPIKIQSLAGSLTINDGNANGFGLQTNSAAGDILLQTLDTNGDVFVGSDINSQGSIAIEAADDLRLDAHLRALGVGTIYLFSANQTLDAIRGIEMLAGTSVSTHSGDVRLVVGNEGDILLSSILAGANAEGNVSLAAEGSILDNNVQSWLMSPAISGANQLQVANSGRITVDNWIIVRNGNSTPELHRVQGVLGNTLTLADGLVADFPGGADTVVTVVNIRANSLRMIADAIIASDGSVLDAPGNQVGSIGSGDPNATTSSLNSRAIDTVVDILAARSADGIYIQEFDDLRIGASAITSILQPRFNSQTTQSVEMSLSDLTTTDQGAIKVVSLNGSIDVSAGNDLNSRGISAHGAGDILLMAYGTSHSISISSNAAVHSESGHISFSADHNVSVLANVETGGSGSIAMSAGNDLQISGQVRSAVGDIRLAADRDIHMASGIESLSGHIAILSGRTTLLESANKTSGDAMVSASQDIVMSSASSIMAGNNLLLKSGNAQTEGSMTLGLLVATNVSLDASGDIWDGNGSNITNIRATNLRAVADSNGDGQGGLGVRIDPVDIEVHRIAAKSSQGIYLQQMAAGGDVTIGHVDAVSATVSVQRVNFDSTTSTSTNTVQIGALDDLETTQPRAGVAQAIELRVDAGNIVVTDGADGDGRGVRVNQLGSILLATVQAGNIAIQTGIETVGTGIHGNITLAAAGSIGELSNDASGSDSAASVVGDSLVIVAGEFAHLHKTSVNFLEATVGSNGLLDGKWQQTNSNANERGDDFLGTLGQARIDHAKNSGVIVEANPSAPQNVRDSAIRDSYDDIVAQFRFADKYQREYALFLQNTKTLEISSVFAGAGNAPNLYVETLGTGSDLNIQGTVLTVSSNQNEGGIVLVAGGKLNLSGQLATSAELPSGNIRTQLIDVIGSRAVVDDFGKSQIAYLNAVAYDAGQGVPPRDLLLTTTEFVLRDQRFGLSASAEDYRSHVFQRVVMQFGFGGEAGFVSLVGYADGEVQQFDVAGEVGVRSKSLNMLDSSDQSAIFAKPSSSGNAAAFTRAIAFENSFLDANQMLPTVAIVRRSADFFLFENASAVNSQDVHDMTFEAFKIDNVVALGAKGATEMPPEVKPVQPPALAPAAPPPLDANPTQLINAAIELGIPRERNFEVAIYRVFYEDDNQNGQAEETELPSTKAVLDAEVIDAEQDTTGTAEVSKDQRLKLESVQTEAGGSPTAEDIEELKNRYLTDPRKPSGAYAVIEKGVDDKEVVLDVFSVRDLNESLPQNEQPIISPPAAPRTEAPDNRVGTPGSTGLDDDVPLPNQDSNANGVDEPPVKLPLDDNASNFQIDRSQPAIAQSRFANSGLLASSLWFATTIATARDRSIIETVIDETEGSKPIQFSRRARRSRRWQKNNPK